MLPSPTTTPTSIGGDDGIHKRAAPIWLLLMLALASTISMHMFAPALPIVSVDLAASPNLTQMSLSSYIVGLAVGQLIYGPASDRIGRRPALIFGTSLFAMASVGAALSTRIDVLIGARFLQALGASAGLTLSRAIVQDCFAGEQAAKKLALLGLLIMVGPAVSPLLGSALSVLFGWRSILLALATLGIVNFVTVLLLLKETVKPVSNGSARGANRYRLLKSRNFLCFALAGGCASTSLYAFISAAPFIFTHQLHRAPAEVGRYLGFNIVGMGLGSFATSQLISRVAPTRLLMTGSLVNCVGAALLLGLTLSGHLTLAGTLLSMFILTCGAGMVAPLALAGAMSVDASAAGSASGLYGCSQMVVGAICSGLAGIGSDHAIAAAGTMFGAGIAALIAFRLVYHLAEQDLRKPRNR
jgi:DHA1 family bicyclomycin/chloramphenicol resistance-like MFS transporter